MPPTESPRVLAERALRLPPAERDDFLQSHTDSAAALEAARAELMRRGASTEADQKSAQEPTAASAGSDALPALDADEILNSLIGTPEAIGPYRIVRRLGEGGMGEVFLAEQTEPVRRQVAVKVIRMGMSTRAVLARFELEQQALARMNHPHIARVFDAGSTPNGQPYFAMEYIDGLPLTTYCEQQDLSLTERIRLFQKICAGVEHAHQKGVLHRDLKPANILVTQAGNEPLVKIIDFGLARAVNPAEQEGASLTAAGDLLGTPDYMAPEQANTDSDQEVDTRTDVYSLGVILYELLTGLLPHAEPTRSRTDVLEVLRRIRETQPLRPSARVRESESTTRGSQPQRHGPRTVRLARRLRGDLDWIVLRAMAKEPERRYATPGALAEDLDRHLNLLPVQAGPDRIGYRAGRLARKYRGPLTAAALLLLAIGVGGGIATHLAFRNAALAEDKTRLADRNLQLARSEAREKQKAQELAIEKTVLAAEAESASQFQSRQLDSLDAVAFGREIREGILREARAEYERQRYDDIDERVDRLRSQLDGLSLTSLAVGTLERGLLTPGLEAIHRDFPDQPLLQARLLQAAGSTLESLGLGEPAAAALERAVALRTDELGVDHDLTLDARHDLGVALLSAGRDAEGEAAMRATYERRAALYGEQDERTLYSFANYAVAVGDSAGAHIAEPLLLRARNSKRQVLGPLHPSTLSTWVYLARSLREQRRFEEAEQEYRAVLEAMRGAGVYSGYAMSDLARLLEELDEFVAAERYSRLAYEQFVERFGTNHPDTLTALQRRASILVELGRHAEAVHWYGIALETAIDVFGSQHPTTLLAKGNYALSLTEQGEFDRAEQLCREVLETRSRVLGDHVQTATAAFNLGDLLERTDRDKDAEPYLARAAKLRLALLGKADRSTAISCNRLGLNLHRQREYERAVEWQSRAAECAALAWHPQHEQALICLSALSASYRGLEEFGRAEFCYRQVLDGQREILGDADSETIETAELHVGYVLQSEGEAAAIDAALDVLSWLSLTHGDVHPVAGTLLRFVCSRLMKAGRNEEAGAYLERAILAFKQTEGADAPTTLDLRDSLGVALQKQGRLAEAEAVFRAVHPALRERFGVDDARTITTASNLGFVLRRSGKSAEAALWIRSVLQWRQRELGILKPATIRAAMDFIEVVEAAARPGDFELLAPYQQLARKGAPPAEHAAYLRALGVTRMTLAAAPTEVDLRRAESFLAAAALRFDGLAAPSPAGESATAKALARLHLAWHELDPDRGHDRAAERFREQAAELERDH